MEGPCEELFSVVEACMMLPKHCKIFGCKIDALWLHASLLCVVEAFVLQMLKEESDIKGSIEVIAAAQISSSAIDGFQERRKCVMWYVPV